MSDENTTNTNVENLNNDIISQVLRDITKSKRESIKAQLKKNLEQIEELKRQIALLEQQNAKTLSDFNAGLI